MEDAPLFHDAADAPDGGRAWWLRAADGLRDIGPRWIAADRDIAPTRRLGIEALGSSDIHIRPTGRRGPNLSTAEVIGIHLPTAGGFDVQPLTLARDINFRPRASFDDDRFGLNPLRRQRTAAGEVELNLCRNPPREHGLRIRMNGEIRQFRQFNRHLQLAVKDPHQWRPTLLSLDCQLVVLLRDFEGRGPG